MIVLSSFTGVTSALANQKSVTVTNSTAYTMTEFYASASSSSTWNTSNNLFAGQTLAPGQQATITINDGLQNCTYDLMAVLYGTTQHAYTYAVNACSGGSWQISSQ
jgi:hypothetical protein